MKKQNRNDNIYIERADGFQRGGAWGRNLMAHRSILSGVLTEAASSELYSGLALLPSWEDWKCPKSRHPFPNIKIPLRGKSNN